MRLFISANPTNNYGATTGNILSIRIHYDIGTFPLDPEAVSFPAFDWGM